MWDEPTTKKDKTIVRVKLPNTIQDSSGTYSLKIINSIYSKLIGEGMTSNSDYEITVN